MFTMKFINPAIFVSKSTGKQLEEPHLFISKEMPRQLPKGTSIKIITKQAKTVKNAVTSSLII